MDTNDFKEALKKDYVPDGDLPFGDLEQYRDAEEHARKTYSLIDDFMGQQKEPHETARAAHVPGTPAQVARVGGRRDGIY